MDKILFADALKNDIWEMVWVGEPNREISVEMTYNDLKIIKNIYESIAEINGWNVRCDEILGEIE